MEERAFVRRSPTDQMQFATRATSKGRIWTGIEAAIYDTSGGVAESPPQAHYGVVMHLGRPIDTLCRCDGLVQRRHSTPGDIDVVPILHLAAWSEDGPTTFLGIHLMPSIVRTAAQGLGLDPDRVSVIPQLQLRDPRLEHIGWALAAELQGADPQGRIYAESLGLALAARLLQRYAPGSPLRFGRGLTKRQLRNVVDYIHENLALDLSLEELAAVAGFSTSHFKSLFKEATNVPVHQYVIQCRVEYAVRLLTNGKSNLSEVASLAGFSDQSHMARCMRRVIGVTPAVVKRSRE